MKQVWKKSCTPQGETYIETYQSSVRSMTSTRMYQHSWMKSTCPQMCCYPIHAPHRTTDNLNVQFDLFPFTFVTRIHITIVCRVEITMGADSERENSPLSFFPHTTNDWYQQQNQKPEITRIILIKWFRGCCWSITCPQMCCWSITCPRICSRSITCPQMCGWSITCPRICCWSITCPRICCWSITCPQMCCWSITCPKMCCWSITCPRVCSRSITCPQMCCWSITCPQMCC
jgi:hypothetical protein